MTTRPHPSTPVRTDAELTERWRALLQLGGPPAQRALFCAWVRRDGTMVPLLVPIEEVGLEPDRALLADLHQLHDTVAGGEDDGLHLALLLERAGPAEITPDDAAWGQAIGAIVRERGGLDCSLHVGNGREVLPLLPRCSWPA